MGVHVSQLLYLAQYDTILLPVLHSTCLGASVECLLQGAACLVMQGGAAVELVPWPHAEQAHEWAQSIQSHFSLNIHVAWTRLTDASHLHYHTEVCFALSVQHMDDAQSPQAKCHCKQSDRAVLSFGYIVYTVSKL